MTYRMNKMKTCYKCKQQKPLTEFHKNSLRPDGHTTACKPCAIEARKQWRIVNRGHAVLRDRKYYSDNAEAIIKKSLKVKKNNPLRVKAHEVIRGMVRTGVITPLPCWVCGEKAEAHHPSYDLPADVVWLCRSHHKQTHAEARNYL